VDAHHTVPLSFFLPLTWALWLGCSDKNNNNNDKNAKGEVEAASHVVCFSCYRVLRCHGRPFSFPHVYVSMCAYVSLQ
jgi:hypothetical protein